MARKHACFAFPLWIKPLPQDLFELTNRIGRLSGFATRVRQLMLGLQVRPPVLSAEIEAAKQGVLS